MRWHTALNGDQWTATVTPDGVVRVMRRKLSKPYRDGDDPSESFETFEFERSEASALAGTLLAAETEALAGETGGDD